MLDKAAPSATEQDPRRKLFASDYFSLLLFGMLNPVLKTTRALSAASALPRVQQEVCSHEVSLGSLSDMQHVVDPQLLAGLLRSLAKEGLSRFLVTLGCASTSRNW